jgi:glycosyltransferase involved in cell wall biosynthesis
MRVLMTVPHPGIDGPIPKLAPLMEEGLRAWGADVLQVPYSRRLATQAIEEPLLRKVGDRSKDLAHLVAQAREYRPDLLFANTSQDWNSLYRDIPMALSCRCLGLPSVLLYHGSRANLLGVNRVLRTMTALLVSLTDGLLLLSSEELPAFQRYWPRHRYGIVPLPAAATMPSGSEPPQGFPPTWAARPLPLVLFVGRLIAEKGIPEVIEAMVALQAATPCRLAVLGEGELRTQLIERVRQLGLEEVVHFAGYVKDHRQVQSWYRSATCLVLPTYWPEGFPVVVLEAMACGLPLVCTAARGMADYLQDGTHALLVPPRDAVTLAARMGQLLADVDLRTRMSAANRQLIQCFQPAHVMRQYLDFFEQVLN